MKDELFSDAWLNAEGLTANFRRQVEGLWGPLSKRILAERNPSRPIVIGLCGPQGSGKSTGAKALDRLLSDKGLSVARLSIDDLYLTRGERRRLAETIHPLLATRGPPGTHDPQLGLRVLTALGRAEATALPRFDKAADDRVSELDWPIVEGPVDVVLFEGWCVGAVSQPSDRLIAPVNTLEAEEDADQVWRRFVNEALRNAYRPLFDCLDLLVLLRAPSFRDVLRWREEQEQKLRNKAGGAGVMDKAALERFVQFYERLTGWIDAEMPSRADVVIALDQARSPVEIVGL